MNNFDFSLYDDEEREKNIPAKKPVVNDNKSFDFSLYDDEAEKPKEEQDEVYNKYYKAAEYSPDELKKMSVQDRYQYAQELKTDREYRQGAGFTRELLSQLSLGFSERIDALKPREGDLNQFPATATGSLAPLGLGFKLLGKGLAMVPKGYKWTKNILQVLGSGAVGGTHEAAREFGKGEELDPMKIGVDAALFAGGDALLKAIPGGYKWLKGLTETQQEQFLTKNLIPENMKPTELKFYQDEIVPELQKIGEQEYQNAYQAAKQQNDLMFQQEMANVRGKHENELFKIQELETQHAQRAKEIEEANDVVMKQYEISKAEWEATKSRENIVKEAIDSANQKVSSRNDFKLTEGEDVGFRPKAPVAKEANIETQVGDIISPGKHSNPTVAGEETTAAIRASAKADQKNVARLYETSDNLNRGIVDSHPEAANELRGIVEDLKTKGNLTPEEVEIIRNAEKTLNGLILFNEEGEAIGFKDVDNQFLLDQAKALRRMMYYDYSESNATGVFNPLIDLYQDAARKAAVDAGNTAAVEANDIARTAHRKWATLYKNRYIRQWRNLSVDKPTALYDGSLNIDNFRQVNKVLSRTNSGQNIAAKTRRDLINKKLGKFYKDPRGSSLDEFNKALDALDPILEPGEKSKILNLFKNSRKTNYIPLKNVKNVKGPEVPKLAKIPETKVSKPSYVNIPLKGEVPITPEMKQAAKLMKLNEDKVMKMTDTPSGLRNLREGLSKSENGKRLFKEIEKKKVARILHKKKYSGHELYDTMNKNVDILTEILGESEFKQLSDAAEKIGESNVQREAVLKFTKNASLIKALSFFGVI